MKVREEAILVRSLPAYGARLRIMAVLLVVAALLSITSCASGDPAASGEGAPVVKLVVRNGSVEHVAVKDFNALVQESDLPVFVDFWATWCPPCKASGPFIEQLAKDYEGRVLFLKVDVDQAKTIASSFNIASIPQFFLIRNGTISGKLTGYATSMNQQFYDLIDAALD